MLVHFYDFAKCFLKKPLISSLFEKRLFLKPKDLRQYNFTASTGDQISDVTLVGDDFKLGDVKRFFFF